MTREYIYICMSGKSWHKKLENGKLNMYILGTMVKGSLKVLQFNVSIKHCSKVLLKLRECDHVHMRTYKHTQLFPHALSLTHTHAQTHRSTHSHAHTRVCARTHTHTHTHIHIDRHTHTHTRAYTPEHKITAGQRTFL